MKLLFKFIVSLTLLGIIVWKIGGLGEVGELLQQINPLYVILVLFVATLDRALMTYKWIRLLQVQDVQFRFIRAMKIYCASMVWGIFLPATIGADVIRTYCARRDGFESKKIVASIIIERMAGFLTALLLGMISLLLLSVFGSLDDRFNMIWLFVGAMLLVTMLAFAGSFSDKIYGFIYGNLFYRFHKTWIVVHLRKLHQTYRDYKDNKGEVGIFFGLTFCEQLIPILLLWLIAVALGIKVSLLYVAGALPLALMISRLPISIDGVGVFEGMFILLMALFGVTATEAVSISLVGRITQLISWMPWWLSYTLDHGSFKAPSSLSKE